MSRGVLIGVASLVLASCAPVESTGDVCAEAAERLVDCGVVDHAPTAAEACDVERAEALAGATCDVVEASEAAGKADGWWDWFLCSVGFRARCPLEQPVRDPATEFFDRYDLPGARVHPEGGAYDSVERAFYVGSLTDAAVYRIDAGTAAVSTFSPSENDDWRTLGVAVDEMRRRLLVCAIHDVDPQHGEVWEYDLGSGERTRHDLDDAAPNGSCNDVAVGPAGDVYVTDREQPHIYRIELGGRVSLFVADAVLSPPRFGLGQNGIVVLPDGEGLVTTTYLPPRLNHIAFTDPPTVRRIEVSGDFHDYTTLGSGADGLVLYDGALFVMFVSELVRVDVEPDWTRGRARSVSTPRGGMSDVIVAEDELYLLNGQAVRFVAGQDPQLPFALFRFDDPLP